MPTQAKYNTPGYYLEATHKQWLEIAAENRHTKHMKETKESDWDEIIEQKHQSIQNGEQLKSLTLYHLHAYETYGPIYGSIYNVTTDFNAAYKFLWTIVLSSMLKLHYNHIYKNTVYTIHHTMAMAKQAKNGLHFIV